MPRYARRFAKRELAPPPREVDAKSGKVARSAGWGVESRTATMEVCGAVPARRLPSAAAGQTPSGPSGHLPQQAGEGVALAVGRQDGRAAAYSVSPRRKFASGAASEHDEGGDHALARGAESSDRRTRLSQANADRTLFRGLRLSCAKDRRRSGRPHARDGECEDQGRREGCMVPTRRISRLAISSTISSSAGCRSLLSGYARRLPKRIRAALREA